MAGFFDTSGYNADPYSGTTNNASADFARLSGNDPSQFGSSIFDRLFDGRNKKEVQQAALATSAAMPAATPAASPSSPAPTPNQVAPANPSLSSGSGLIRRILGSIAQPPTHNQNGEALAPGTPFTTQQLLQKFQELMQTTLPPFQGIPQFPNPQPPMRQAAPAPQGTFGNMPGQMAGAAAGPAASAHPGIPIMNQTPMPGQAPTPLQRMQTFGRPQTMSYPQGGPAPEMGYFRGGALRLMRGGYPDHLMMGLPTRMAHGEYVSPDGQGDGRSDHVDAKLSPGEYVMDAETTALLGNGDGAAGARKLDEMRANIRKQKGRALAKGHFSPDAKPAAAYLRGKS